MTKYLTAFAVFLVAFSATSLIILGAHSVYDNYHAMSIGDVNHDGVVDSLDLSIVSAHWTNTQATFKVPKDVNLTPARPATSTQPVVIEE